MYIYIERERDDLVRFWVKGVGFKVLRGTRIREACGREQPSDSGQLLALAQTLRRILQRPKGPRTDVVYTWAF